MQTLKLLFFTVLIAVGESQRGSQRQAAREFFHGEEVETNFVNSRRFVPAPIPVVKIMKQMSEMHEDGSYTFGYESQDGSFRIETRSPDGMTKGKYGFRDESGVLHEIDYTAGGTIGYAPKGAGIVVPPRAPPPQRSRPEFETSRRFEEQRFDEEPASFRSNNRGPLPPQRRIAEPVEDTFIRPQPSRRNVNPMIEYITNLQPWSRA